MPESYWTTSAEVYARQVKRISFYRRTNHELIAAGQVRPGMVVVDLACGTGLTIHTLLQSVKAPVRIYAVDGSGTMLDLARKEIPDLNIWFIQAGAEAFADRIPTSVDRVFCNAAFFHFDPPENVLNEVRAVLKPDGWFLFNIPDQDFDFGDGLTSSMQQQVAACLDRPNSSRQPRFSYSKIEAMAKHSGLAVRDYRILEIPIDRDDLLRFYSIPHVGVRWFPDLAPEKRRDVFQRAFQTIPVGKNIIYRWGQFVLSPLSFL